MLLVDIFARDQLAFVRTKENRPIIAPVGPDTILLQAHSGFAANQITATIFC